MRASYSRTFAIFLSILALLLVALLIFVFFRQQEITSELYFTYNGFRFERDASGYKIFLYINNQATPASIHLREDPRTLEDIPVRGDVQLLHQKQQLYVTIDPYANLTGKTTIGALEIDAIIDNPYLFNIQVSSAFTQPYGNSTVKTCASINATEGVILLQKAQQTQVREEQGCVYVEGVTEDDIIRASDRLAYTLLKIMDA